MRSRAFPPFAVLIPARDEATVINRVVEECLVYCEYILVVDDGSRDGTGIRASNSGAHVLVNPGRAGLGSALAAGLDYLQSEGFDLVVTLDGDGAHDPTFIPSLLEDHLSKGADLTLGSRFINDELAARVPSPKRAANFFATGLLNELTKAELTDAASGMRVLAASLFDLGISSLGYEFAYDLIAQTVRRRLVITESPIGVRYDADELLCTSREELLDLLSFAIRFTENIGLGSELRQLKRSIEGFSRIRLEVAGRHLVLHPIRDCQGFVFQFQSPWYVGTRNEISRDIWRRITPWDE